MIEYMNAYAVKDTILHRLLFIRDIESKGEEIEFTKSLVNDNGRFELRIFSGIYRHNDEYLQVPPCLHIGLIALTPRGKFLCEIARSREVRPAKWWERTLQGYQNAAILLADQVESCPDCNLRGHSGLLVPDGDSRYGIYFRCQHELTCKKTLPVTDSNLQRILWKCFKFPKNVASKSKVSQIHSARA
jgi:hypothetical protein